MPSIDPTTAAQRWVSGLSGAGQKITDGIRSVTTAPGQSAARQKGAWVQNTTAAADKWAANTAAVSLSDWQNAAVSKGVPRIASGATAAEAKMASFLQQLFPHIDSVKSSLPARGSFDQNVQRMVAFSQGMHKFQKRA